VQVTAAQASSVRNKATLGHEEDQVGGEGHASAPNEPEPPAGEGRTVPTIAGSSRLISSMRRVKTTQNAVSNSVGGVAVHRYWLRSLLV